MIRVGITRATCAALALGALWADNAPAQDRATNWRLDLERARTEFLERDRSYSQVNRARAEGLLRDLEANVDSLSDQDIMAGLAQAAAMAENAHTRAYLLRNRGLWRRYPIRIWKFGDEWRVVAARPEHARLVGARLVAIGGAPIDDAERRVRPLFAGNDNWARYMASYSLTSPDALLGMGVIEGSGSIRLRFEIDGRRRRITLAPEPFERRDRPEESWWFLSPIHPASAGWVHVLRETRLPPSLEGAASNYRFLRCSNGVAYLQFNRAQDMEGAPPVATFGQEVLAQIQADPPERLVFDLRFNTGGDLSLGGYFVRDLSRSQLAQTPGAVFVVMGPNTFSAGITHVVQMRQGSRALLVGTEPGDGLEFWSEGGNVLLPNSGINMHFADRAHTYSVAPSNVPPDLVALDLNVEHLRPDVAADWTWEAYRAGRDPYLEAALGAPLTCDAPPG